MVSVGDVRGGGWKRGDFAKYIHAPEEKLLIISEPYDYGGRLIVSARTCEKSRAKRRVMLFECRALLPWTGKE